jgi:hypothetical protein
MANIDKATEKRGEPEGTCSAMVTPSMPHPDATAPTAASGSPLVRARIAHVRELAGRVREAVRFLSAAPPIHREPQASLAAQIAHDALGELDQILIDAIDGPELRRADDGFRLARARIDELATELERRGAR